MLDLLLDKGASAHRMQDHRRTEGTGWGLLHLAAAHGADDARWLAWCCSRAVDLEQRTAAGETPLMLACEHGQVHAAYHLLMRGASPNERDAKGDTALIRCARRRGAHHIAMLLLLGGADVAAPNGALQQTAADVAQVGLRAAFF